ncbi:MAG: hypothetical protein QJT81_12580 [Candidatus Thiothrix putei]|uniref:PD-(D/E)XK nuclease superfamily protein n=1 Tax=Candidatus Thiothrix putei TaxID=3080811 RepID=A0AA95HD92_9GAMM|nr:MAG: hypothetical protein QJT81_12580 [Candidatus Thiothrix putei]
MKLSFQVYKNTKTKIESSIFDLISGDGETKQTKGLAYLFSQNHRFCLAFLNKFCQTRSSYLNEKDILSIKIIAEAFTSSGKRIDILILIKKPKLNIAFVIEAKEVNISTSLNKISKQINFYNNHEELKLNKSYELKPIIITKYKHISKDTTSVTWTEITSLISIFLTKDINNNKIMMDYYSFLIGVSKEMNYYEKEVLSIPAGKSIDFVKKHLIYECPNTTPYNYKKSIFICFRESGGGQMDMLYKLDEIVIFDRADEDSTDRLYDLDLNKRTIERLKNYIADTNYQHSSDVEKKLYILSENKNIKLKHLPRPERNNAKYTYYSLHEILGKEIVTPESKE